MTGNALLFKDVVAGTRFGKPDHEDANGPQV